MKDTTLISVVTPIYNGERFLMSAYECLCHQTYTNWEWVVVNDGSIDGTEALFKRLAFSDERIKYCSQRNSGSAKYPRDRAVYLAHGKLILPLDIDDTVSNNYLELMLRRMEETDADIVYPQMRFIDLKTRQTIQVLPVADFDTERVYQGRDLIARTLPEWEIGCNGGLYRKEMWGHSSYPEKKEPIWVYSDEIDERYYQLKARRVAFSKARYYYRYHEESITNSVTPKRFQLLCCNVQLMSFIEKEFGKDSEEYKRVNLKLFYSWRTMAAFYMQNYEKLTDGDDVIQEDLRKAFQRIDASRLPTNERIKFFNLTDSRALLMLFGIKYAPKWIFEKVIQRYMPLTYRRHYIRQRTEDQVRQQIAGSYMGAERKKTFQPYAVSMFCGNAPSGGLVDRLRGAVSLYETCKACKRDFRIYFTHPFLLSDYLEPNQYDWRIETDEVTFADSQALPVVVDTQTATQKERTWQKSQFVKALKQDRKLQLHFYSNALFCYDTDFSKLFNELFKPGKRLQSHLDNIFASIGTDYISVSARFCGLLGDFNEETYSEPLSAEEQQELLDATIKQLAVITHKYPDKKVIVCSDSTTFLEQAVEQCNVAAIPGNISHIGNDTVRNYEYYEKTFLDFFVIAHASQVFLLKSSVMHNSGFPYAAARVGKRPFHLIEF